MHVTLYDRWHLIRVSCHMVKRVILRSSTAVFGLQLRCHIPVGSMVVS